MAAAHTSPPSTRLPIPLPAGIYYGWVILAVVWMANFMGAFLSPLIFVIFIAPMQEELGFSLSQLAWVGSVGQVSAGLAAPFVGRLIDAYGTRWLGVIAAVVAGTAMICMSLVSNIWIIYFIFAISGISGLGAFGGNLITAVPPANWFVAKRGRAMAISFSGITLGITLGIPFTQLLIQTIGWRSAWVVFGIMMYLLVIPAHALLMRRRPEDLGLHPDGAVSPADASLTVTAGAAAVSKVEASWTLQQALRTPVFWLIIGLMTLNGFATAAILFMRVPFWTGQGVSAQDIATGVPIDPFTVMIGNLVLGFVAERFPVQILAAFGGVFRAISMLPMLFMQGSLASVLAHNFTWGLGSAGFSQAQNLLIPMFFGRQFQGSIRGVQVPINIAASATGAPLAAYLVDSGMEINFVWLAGMALMLSSGLAFLLAKPPKLELR